MNNLEDGASFATNPIQACINLVPVVNMLNESITKLLDSNVRIFEIQNNSVIFNSGQIMAKHHLTEGFKQIKSKEPNKGFFQYVAPSPTLLQTTIGGRIVPGTNKALSTAVWKLAELIDQELHRVTSKDLQLLCQEGALLIGGMAQRLEIKSFNPNTSTKIAPFKITSSQSNNTQDLARVLDCVETVYGSRDEHLENLITSIKTYLQRDGIDPADLEEITDNLHTLATNPNQQLARFLDFLEQEILYRLRLYMGLHLMEGIASDLEARKNIEYDPKPFITYVRRVSTLIHYFANPNAEVIQVNLSFAFGAAGEFSFNEILSNVIFYNCLPVWCHAQSIVFETADKYGAEATEVIRHINYHFRINGINPEYGETAFLSRILEIKSKLQQHFKNLGAANSQISRYDLATMIFLATIFRDDDIVGDGSAEAAALGTTVAKLQNTTDIQQLIGKIQILLTKLQALDKSKGLKSASKQSKIDAIAKILVKSLQTRGKILKQLLHPTKPIVYHINIERSLINFSKVEDCASEILNIDNSKNELAEFIKYTTITPHTSTVQALNSIRVEVTLSEHSITKLDTDPITMDLEHAIPDYILPVVIQPGVATEQTVRNLVYWAFPSGLIITYDPKFLQLSESSRNEDNAPSPPKRQIGQKERSQEANDIKEKQLLLASYRTAFSILLHVLLRRLEHYVRHRLNLTASPTMLILRTQTEKLQATPAYDPNLGKHQPSTGTAAETVYAISQALEIALADTIPVRVQGIIETTTATDAAIKYKRNNSFYALQAAFPLLVSHKHIPSPELNQIALISFSSRPCARTPAPPDQPEDSISDLFITRTYRLHRIDATSSDYLVWADNSRTQIQMHTETNKELPILATEIKRLYDQGIKHIIYLSQQYYDRKLGRASKRRTFNNPSVLDYLNQGFPGLMIYPLVRELFYATRIKKAADQAQAYEAIAKDHAFNEKHSIWSSEYIPVYSLATLKIVGKEEEERPQSGFSAYFLHNDPAASDTVLASKTTVNLLDPNSKYRDDLISALRAVHFLEREKAPVQGMAGPVLNPYLWMRPVSIGEITVVPSVKYKTGPVVLSILAVAHQVTSILNVENI